MQRRKNERRELSRDGKGVKRVDDRSQILQCCTVREAGNRREGETGSSAYNCVYSMVDSRQSLGVDEIMLIASRPHGPNLRQRG